MTDHNISDEQLLGNVWATFGNFQENLEKFSATFRENPHSLWMQRGYAILGNPVMYVDHLIRIICMLF